MLWDDTLSFGHAHLSFESIHIAFDLLLGTSSLDFTFLFFFDILSVLRGISSCFS